MSSSQNTSIAGLVKSTVLLPFRLASYIALEPIATGLLLYALTKAPTEVRDTLLRTAENAGIHSRHLASIITPLKYLFAVGIIRRLGRALNQYAENYYHLRPQGQPWKFGDEKLSELVLITGGCSGFGALMTKGFVGKARIVIIDILDQPEDLKLPGVHYYHCDVTNTAAITEIANTIRQAHGNPSVLINNAGIGTSATVLKAKPEFIDKIFQVNLVSHFHLVREFLPGMLEARKGHIVTLASITSFLSVPGIVHYACTKTAVNFLNDGLRSELLTRYKNGHTIRLTSVHPNFHDTPMVKDFRHVLQKSGLPLHPASNVANKVVEQVLKGRSGKLFMPESDYYISFVKALPLWVFDLIAGHIREARTGARLEA